MNVNNKNILISVFIFITLCIFLVRSNSSEQFQDLNILDKENEDELFGEKKNIDDTVLDEDTLVAYQDFTKFAIKGDKGEPGEKGDRGGRGIQGLKGIKGDQGESLTGSITSTGKLWLGAENKGKSGINANGEVQLYLGGAYGQGANNGRGGQTTYKLKIDGYDNTGSTVYPIYCRDKNGNVDLYLKNRKSSTTRPLLNISGDIRLESSKSVLDCRGNIVCVGSFTCNGIIKSKNTLESNNLNIKNKAMIKELTSTNYISDKGKGIYFQNTNSNFTGWARREGNCSIQNAKNYKCLMLLGRMDKGIRKVGVWDQLNVNGSQNITNNLSVNGNTTLRGTRINGRLVSTDQLRMNGNGIVFDNVNSNHTGWGNTNGYACIENGKNYNSLMILGRSRAKGPGNWATGYRRQVSIWDDCYVAWDMKVRYQIWCSRVNQRSDRNLKININTIKDPLKILKLDGVSFNWKNENKDLNRLEYGFVAQEVEKIVPELVSGEEGNKSVNYIGTIPFLLETIKYQQKEISRISALNSTMNKRLELLENEIFKFT